MATNFVAKLWQNYLPPCNGMTYRYLNVLVNSIDDAFISSENSVKFGPLTPELTELICERQVRHGQKTGAFSQISPDILDRFSQFFHRVKAFYVQMMDLYLILQFVKGRCHGNQIMLQKCYQRRLIPLAEMTGLINVPIYLYWAKIDLTPAFVVLPFRNATEYCYADGRINSSNDHATSDINLVGF